MNNSAIGIDSHNEAMNKTDVTSNIIYVSELHLVQLLWLGTAMQSWYHRIIHRATGNVILETQNKQIPRALNQVTCPWRLYCIWQTKTQGYGGSLQFHVIRDRWKEYPVFL